MGGGERGVKFCVNGAVCCPALMPGLPGAVTKCLPNVHRKHLVVFVRSLMAMCFPEELVNSEMNLKVYLSEAMYLDVSVCIHHRKRLMNFNRL